MPRTIGSAKGFHKKWDQSDVVTLQQTVRWHLYMPTGLLSFTLQLAKELNSTTVRKIVNVCVSVKPAHEPSGKPNWCQYATERESISGRSVAQISLIESAFSSCKIVRAIVGKRLIVATNL
jgi:hypothetical protein